MKREYKFLVILIAFIPILLSAHLLLLFFFTGLDESLLWVAEMKVKKEAAVQSLPPPRILVFGGSGTLLGTSARILSQELGVPAINLGLHARLGLAFYLRESKKLLRPGDTMLLIPEYELYQDRSEFTPMAFDYYRVFEPTSLRGMSLGDELVLAKFLLVRHPFDSFLKHLKYRYFTRPGTTGYQSEKIDEYGDQTAFAGVGYLGLDKNFRDEDANEVAALPQLKAHADWCRKNKIRFLLSFAPVAKPKNVDDPAVQLYLRNLPAHLKKAGLEIVGQPTDFLYDRKYFTDFYYHMATNGIRLHSAKIVELLRSVGVGRRL